ncbi:MAG: hypothetical protein HQK52_21820 [Oligoflexia bacterium]|nr:hypothetical protein [Oligoflexia bacterium]
MNKFNVKKTLLLLFFTAISSNALQADTIIGVNNGCHYGVWRDWAFCPVNAYAIGIRTKIEGRQHGGDDTSLNAVTLLCQSVDLSRPAQEMPRKSWEGPWGGWGDWGVLPGAITGFQLLAEPPQGGNGDDTGANDIRIFDANGNSVVPANGNAFPFGGWGSLASCPPGEVVVGINVQAESPGGSDVDDTAINNVQMLCRDAAQPIVEGFIPALDHGSPIRLLHGAYPQPTPIFRPSGWPHGGGHHGRP